MRRLTLGLALATAVVLASTGVASAAIITVTTTQDQYGEDTGNCGLREAIRSAEGLDAGGYGGCAQGDDFDLGAVSDTINVPAGTYNLTIPGFDDANSFGDLDILDNSLTIASTAGLGQTTTIVGTGGDRVIHGIGSFSFEVTGIRIRNGAAATQGGGISAGGALTLTNVTLDGNTAGSTGGGLFAGSAATLKNVTISGNSAAGAGGGFAHNNAGTSVLKNVTVVNNTADSDQAGGETGGGIANIHGTGSVNVANTIVADNRLGGALVVPDDCDGNIASSNFNLIGTSQGCNFLGAGSGDLVGTLFAEIPANLAPLAANGGTTFTRLPLRSSPAINRGYPPTGAPPGSPCEAFDANDVGRPLDGRCDIGAVEAPGGPQTINTNTAADEYDSNFSGNCSLREAVQAANDNQAFGGCPAGSLALDTVNLPQAVSLTRAGDDSTNVNSDIDVNAGNVTIAGTGSGLRTIDNNSGGDRVLEIASGITGVTVRNVDITGGDTGADGGGILNAGSLALLNSSVRQNITGGHGGGISYTATGTGTIVNSTISGNASFGSGGGIANSQPTAFQPTFRNVTITNNTADQDNSGLDGSGGYAGFAGGADIANSILAGNTDVSSNNNPNCGGAPPISSGFNIAGADCGLAVTGDTSTLSGLAALADNGGNSLTHALQAGSPAINTGNPGPGGALCASTDQRGTAREGICDRGAFEFVTPQGGGGGGGGSANTPTTTGQRAAALKKCKKKKAAARKKCKKKANRLPL